VGPRRSPRRGTYTKGDKNSFPPGHPSTRRGVRGAAMRTFDSLSEKEILALAISQEEEDARIYADFAEGLSENYPDTAKLFREMREEEDGHRHRLLNPYRERVGEHTPLTRRQAAKGCVHGTPIWLVRPRGRAAREGGEGVGGGRGGFEGGGGRGATDVNPRQLLGDLAEEERRHSHLAEALGASKVTPQEAESRHRLFVLQVVQPGLAGLMD